MGDMASFDFLLENKNIDVLVLIFSIVIIFVILLINAKSLDKSLEKLQAELSQIKKSIEIHGTYLKQFNDHFGQLDQRLKSIEEITALTGRDISSMADGISGEVGVGKAIELARRGASVDEIIEKSNLKRDQAELIFKFHGISEPN